METVNEILYFCKPIIVAVVTVISTLSTLAAIWECIVPKEKQKRKLIILCSILGVCGVLGILYTNSLVQVPDVLGKSYEDAKRILISAELDFNTLRESNESIVIEQSVVAGEIVTKDTLVILMVEEESIGVEFTGEKSEILETLKQKNVRFFYLHIQLYEYVLSIQDKYENCIIQIGNEIDYNKLNAISVENSDYGVVFSDYQIIKGYKDDANASIVFKEEMPMGKLWLYIEVDGCDTFNKEWQGVMNSADVQKEESLNVVMMPSEHTKLYPYSVRIVDENFEAYACQTCAIKLSGEGSHWYGIELSDDSSFYLKSMLETEFVVDITDDFGYSYSCDVVFDNVATEIYIVITPDGNIYQADYGDYLNAISK